MILFTRRIISIAIALLMLLNLSTYINASPEDTQNSDTSISDTTDTPSQSEPSTSNESSRLTDVITLDEMQRAFLNETFEDAPTVNCSSYILYDSLSDTILLGKDIDTPLEPASTTKLMTVLLAIENCNMDDIVTITPSMYNSIPNDYVKLGMTEGEEFTVEDLIYASMLKSCNDAALALAIHIGGTEQQFYKMMNDKAKELGCTATNFTTAYGYADPNNVISVYDMSLILKKCISYPVFTDIATSSQYTISATNKYGDKREITNANRFISTQQYSYEYYIGGKTGYTDTAGNTIVAATRKNGRVLIGCIFGAPDSEMRYSDLINLFNYGYTNFTTVSIDETEYKTIFEATRSQIEQVLVDTDLEITDYTMDLCNYHTTTTSRALTGCTAVIELNDVIIDSSNPSQTFDIPFYRVYTDGKAYQVGSIHLLIEAKGRLQEINPKKNSMKSWAAIRNLIVTVAIISLLAIILIIALLLFRKRNIARKEKEYHQKSKML